MAASADLKFRHCMLFFCFYDCSLFRSKPVSTSWCFGARAGASCNYEQSKTKWKRHLEHCLWYGSLGRPKFGQCLLFFVFMIVFSLGQSLQARAGASWIFEQYKTKWKRHIEHCLWYGSFGRPKFGHCFLWLFTLKVKACKHELVLWSTSWCFVNLWAI